MVAVRIAAFGGMLPAVDDRLLPDNNAVHAENTWLYSGAMIGMNAPRTLRTLTNSAATKAYRIPTDYADASTVQNSTWMEFTDMDTDVIRSLVVGDTYDRYYYVSPSVVPKYNTKARIVAGTAPYLLGIPAPAAITGSVTGGSGVTETRAYVATWVSLYGEEGPPSDPVLITGYTNGSWDLTLTAADADDLDGPNRDLDNVRIYRTVTSASGIATYFYVAEQIITDTTYSDTASDATVSANEQISSTNWTAPPTDLDGWVTLPNGIIAGWRLNEIWFCEPYRPHAWPSTYAISVEFPIVGLGVINQTLVVCTSGSPATATGVAPASMTLSKIAALEPCLSRGSIVSTPEGVYYVSPNGLVLVAPGRADNITKALVTKNDWQDLVAARVARSVRLGGGYYCFGTARDGVYETTAFQTTAFAQEDYTGAFSGIFVDPTSKSVAFNIQTSDDAVTNVFSDTWSGEVFLIKDGVLLWLDLAQTTPTITPAIWRSKIFQPKKGDNFQAMKVYFEIPAGTGDQGASRVNTLVQTLATDQYGLVRVYADGVLKMTRELRTSGELWKLPSGFKADFWQFEIEARVRIMNLQVATSVKELTGV